MKPIRALPLLVLLPLLPAVWATLASEAKPEAGPPPVPFFVPAPADLTKPLPGLTPNAPARERARVAGQMAAERPHWPAEWPSLDAFPAIHGGGSAAAMQMMGSGDFDVEVPGSGATPPADDVGEAADGAEAERRPASVVDEFEQRPEIAEGRRRREEAQRRREAEELEEQRRAAEEFQLTDEERAERDARRRAEEEEWRKVIAEIDAEIDQGGDPFQGPPPTPDPGGDPDAEPEVERPTTQTTIEGQPATPAPATGYRFTTPEGNPVERFVVGESFVVELRLTPEDASIPGRAGGRRELDFVEVGLSGQGGDEQTVRLWRSEEPSEDGLIRFTSREPISIGATVNGNSLPGTMDGLGLDLLGDEAEPEALSTMVRVRSLRNATGGFTTFTLYGKAVTAAIAEVEDALDVVETYLRNERELIETLLVDAKGDGEIMAQLSGERGRIDAQMSVVETARSMLRNERNVEYKFALSKKLLDTLVVHGPGGWEVSETNPLRTWQGTTRSINDILFAERKRLDEKYTTRGIVPMAAFGTIAAYLETSYSQFAHATLGAPIFTLATGQDELGQEASRLWAVVEIGGALVALKIPGAIRSYIDEGRLIPSKDLDFRRSPAGERLPSRRGQVAEMTGQGQNRAAVYRGAPNRPIPQLPGETRAPTPRAPGAGAPPPSAGPVERRGVTAEEIQRWRQRENPTDPKVIEDFNEKMASMDDAVATARRRGVPDDVIEGVLTQAREQPSLGTAEPYVTGRLEWEIATRNRERIFVSTAERQELGFNSTLPDAAATPQHLAGVTEIDKITLESVVAKSHLEASGKPQTWTVNEIETGRSIVRRLEAGEDVRQWKTVDLDEGPGLRPLFGSDDLGAIRSTFTSRPLRVGTEVPAVPRQTGSGRPAAQPAPIAEDAVTTQAPPPARTVDPAAPTERIDPTERIAPAERVAPTERMAPAERAAAVEDATPTQRLAPAEPTEAPVTPARLVDPVAEPTALGGPSGRGQPSGLEVMIRSLGGSTGRVVEAYFVNHGDEPVRIQASGVALEPVALDEASRARADEILDAATQGKPLPPPEPDDDRSARAGARLGAGPMPLPAAWRGANVVRVVLEGYCLELGGGVPTEGVFFRIADVETQAANQPLRAILESSRVLRDRGELHPDTEPDAYFHSIRQWAVWVLENEFDREGFEKEFVAHTSRNFEAAEREWTREAEELLQEFIPNRWNDVVAVLEGAGLAVPAGDAAGRSSR